MEETQEARIWSLGQDDPLEKEMATHCCILAWRISWTDEPGRLQSMGSQRVGHDRSDLGCSQWNQKPTTPPGWALLCLDTVCLDGQSTSRSCGVQSLNWVALSSQMVKDSKFDPFNDMHGRPHPPEIFILSEHWGIFIFSLPRVSVYFFRNLLQPCSQVISFVK